MFVYTHSLNEVIPLGVMVSPKSQRLSNETPSTNSLDQRNPRHSQNNVGHCHCPWLFPRTWLLKTIHIPDIGGGGIELQLTGTFPPWRPTLIVSEGALQASQVEKQLVVLSMCKADEPQQFGRARYPQRCNSVTFILGLTHSLLIGLKASSVGKNSLLIM